MASILKVDSIGKTSGSTQDTMAGLAKAWVNFDGTATNAAARGSFNNSSMTDNAGGDYTITLSNAVDSTNNIVASGLCTDDITANDHVANISLKRQSSGNNPFTTTSIGIIVNFDGQTSSPIDMDFVTVAIHGDLA
tara:strand:+ start:93 stop:500 length:408 start_codon:yes stop_codon:yes gene_type:complete